MICCKNMLKHLWVVLLLLAVACSKTPRQESFPIVSIYGPDKDMIHRQAFEQLRNAGFNINLSNFNDPKLNLKALDVANQVGVKLILVDRRIEAVRAGKDSSFAQLDSVVADYASHPAFWGYFIQDEPGAGDFEKLAVIKRYLARKDSLHPVYINLFPTYATKAQLGTESYQEYVRRFISIVEPDFLSFDHYPILKYGIREDYYQNLEIVRREALANNLNFWAFTLSVPHGPYPMPEHSHIRLQLYSALAYGARGLQYFTYTTPKIKNWDFRDAIINSDGEPTATYQYAMRINAEIRKLAPVLLRLKSTGVYHSLPVPQGCSALVPHLPVVKIEGRNILAGFFADEDNKKYLMLVNKNYLHGAMPRIHFADSVKKIIEIPRDRNAPLKISWPDSQSDKNTAILFKAGDGRLFRIVD